MDVATVIIVLFSLLSLSILILNKDKVLRMLSNEMIVRGALFCFFYFVSAFIINYFFDYKKNDKKYEAKTLIVEKEYNTNKKILMNKDLVSYSNEYKKNSILEINTKYGTLFFDTFYAAPVKYVYYSKFAPKDKSSIIAYDYSDGSFSPNVIIIDKKIVANFILKSQNKIDDEYQLIFESHDNHNIVTVTYTIKNSSATMSYEITITSDNAFNNIRPLLLFSHNNDVFSSLDVFTSFYLNNDNKIKYYKDDKKENDDFLINTSYLFGYSNEKFVDFLMTSLPTEHFSYNNKRNNKIFIILPELDENNVSFKAQWYIGLKEYHALKQIDKNIAYIYNYGIFTRVAEFVMIILEWLFSLTGNFGFAIILFSFLLSLILLPVHYFSRNSVHKRAEFAKKLKYINEKYRDDKQRLESEKEKLMKEYGLMPGGAGCIPQLIQLPVMLSIQQLLRNPILLYNAPFIGWISNIALPDPYYILPALSTLLIFIRISQNISAQKKIALLIGAFAIFFLLSHLSAGTLLFTFSNALFGLLQMRLLGLK